jgi:pilus assembly protein CpaF
VTLSPAQVDNPVFTIIVSEKGGSERREVFDRPEISVGRVQGNELMLPKGNVSKRHARLLYREGRFIVTDLNSTNGTYVNRRRIAQATIVKQGDKIYIGDFVLRIELSGAAGDSQPAPGESSASGTGRVMQLASAADDSASGSASGRLSERDDESSSDTGGRTPRMVSPSRAVSTSVHTRPEGYRLPSDAGALDLRSPLTSSQPDVESLLHRSSLVALVDRVVLALDPDGLEHEPVASLAPRVRELVWANLRTMQNEGQIPPELPLEQLAHDAEAELVDTGPLAPLLEDHDTTEIAVLGSTQIIVVRSGQSCPLEMGFSSEAALRRAIMRLCRRAGEPLGEMETLVQRRLPGGGMLWAAFQPAAMSGSIVLIRKLRQVSVSLEQLVSQGAVSQAMATFLEQCMAARLNVLVVGPQDPGTAAVVSALCGTIGPDHVIAIEDVEDIAASARHVTRLSTTHSPQDAGQLVALASHIPNARIVAELSTPETTSAILEIAGAGTQGLVAMVRAGSLRRGLNRLVAELMVARPGLTSGAAREWVAAGFGVALEVKRLRDGAYRVVRVGELDGGDSEEIRVQDLFSFTVERAEPDGRIEGAFHASGSIPRVMDEITSRGIRLDSSVFTKS